MHREVPLNKILANPDRDPKKYPVDRKKVETLKVSFNQTGVWANLVARDVKGRSGFVELAYGYHRLVAMQEVFGKTSKKTFSIDVRELSDAFMLKMMAQENMEQHNNPEEVESETVRAVILAYAAGRITKEMEVLKPKPGHVLYAPHFRDSTSGSNPSKGVYPYTVSTLAEFLGWPDKRVKSTLERLAIHEEAPETAKITKGMGPRAATELVQATKRLTGAKAKPAVVAKKMKQIKDEAVEETGESGGTVRGVRRAAEKVRVSDQKKKKEIPDIETIAKKKLLDYLGKVLRSKTDMKDLLDIVVTHKDAEVKEEAVLSDSTRKRLCTALRQLSERCMKYHSKLEK